MKPVETVPIVVIVEGPDGAGKSTLAKHLSKIFGWPLVHTGGPLKDREEFMDRVDRLQLMNPTQHVIVDRTPFISDLVYAPLSNRAPVVSEGDLFDMINWVDPLIIYCRLESKQKMLDNILATAKTHKPPEYLAKVRQNHPGIVQRYDKVMNKIDFHERFASRPSLIRYAWDQDDGSIIIARIHDRLRDSMPRTI